MLLMVNIDDVNMELLPLYVEELLEREAKNVHYVYSSTKKGRMGVIAFVDVEDEFVDGVLDYLASEVGTIGLRILEAKHLQFEYSFERVYISSKNVKCSCNVKIVKRESNKHVKVEYDDLKDVSKKLSIPAIVLKSIIETFVFSEEDRFECTLYGERFSLWKENIK